MSQNSSSSPRPSHNIIFIDDGGRQIAMFAIFLIIALDTNILTQIINHWERIKQEFTKRVAKVETRKVILLICAW